MEAEPDNSVLEGWDAEMRVRFGRWLGRRYGRPVLSETDVAEVQRPVRERWQRLANEEPELAATLNAQFSEFRFRRVDGGIEIFVLAPIESPDEELALEAFGILQEALEPIHGNVAFDPVRITYHRFTRADDLTTEAIDLEWASDAENAEMPAD